MSTRLGPNNAMPPQHRYASIAPVDPRSTRVRHQTSTGFFKRRTKKRAKIRQTPNWPLVFIGTENDYNEHHTDLALSSNNHMCESHALSRPDSLPPRNIDQIRRKTGVIACFLATFD